MKKRLYFILIILSVLNLSCEEMFVPKHFMRIRNGSSDIIKDIEFGSYYYPQLRSGTTSFYEFINDKYDLDYYSENIFGSKIKKCTGFFSFSGIGTHYWEMEISGCSIVITEIRKP